MILFVFLKKIFHNNFSVVLLNIIQDTLDYI